MTRKDFELIAKAISDSRQFVTAENQDIIDNVAESIIDEIKKSHPRFSEFMFRIASGIVQHEIIDGVTHVKTGNHRVFKR